MCSRVLGERSLLLMHLMVSVCVCVALGIPNNRSNNPYRRVFETLTPRLHDQYYCWNVSKSMKILVGYS
jgi:hypothetical protein